MRHRGAFLATSRTYVKTKSQNARCPQSLKPLLRRRKWSAGGRVFLFPITTPGSARVDQFLRHRVENWSTSIEAVRLTKLLLESWHKKPRMGHEMGPHILHRRNTNIACIWVAGAAQQQGRDDRQPDPEPCVIRKGTQAEGKDVLRAQFT